MAEFMDVIRIVTRICKRNNGKCLYCKLGGFACPNNVRFDTNDEARFQKFEEVVVKLAEEDLRLVYPSVAECLEQFGIIIRRDGMLQADLLKAYEPMRIDIAQKLRIKPKLTEFPKEE